jgi:hypothetical protein
LDEAPVAAAVSVPAAVARVALVFAGAGSDLLELQPMTNTPQATKMAADEGNARGMETSGNVSVFYDGDLWWVGTLSRQYAG